MFKYLFLQRVELCKLKSAFQDLHNRMLIWENSHALVRTTDGKGILVWNLIVLAHFANAEINSRIKVYNEHINSTVFLARYGNISLAIAYQFTVNRLVRLALEIGVHTPIIRLLSNT
jgi:hypothetical protein